MPIEVELPDGTVAEFPDGTSTKTMEMALAKYRESPPAAPAPRAAAATRPKPNSVQIAERSSPSLGRRLWNNLDAFTHHATGPIVGLVQGMANLQAAANPWSPGAQSIAGRLNAGAERREREYQERTGDSGYVGAFAGQVAPWLVGVGAARSAGILPKLAPARDIPGVLGKAGNVAKKAAALSAGGGIEGALTPVSNGQPYFSEMGTNAAIGAVAAPALGAAGATVSGGIRGVRQGARYLTPGGRDAIANERLAGLLGEDGNVLDILSRAPQYVAGEQPTLAQVVASPRAVQVERALRNNPQAGVAFAEQDVANNAARMEALRRLAGSDDDLNAAIANRRANAQAFRQQYLPEEGGPLVDVEPLITRFSRLSLDGDKVVASAAGRTLSLLRRHAKENGGKVPASILDNLRDGAGTTLREMSRTGAVSTKQEARYGPAVAEITDAIDRAVPGYRDYLAAYARDSAPINDMEAARRLIADRASAGLDGGGGQLLSIPALRQTLRLDDRANFPMSDAARREFENILASLQRRSISDNKIAASGPGTAAEVGATMLDSPVGRSLSAGAGGILGTIAGGPVGGAIGLLASEGTRAARRDIVRRVGEKAASAPKARAAIEAARRQRQKALSSGVPSYLLPWDARN